MRQVSIKGGIHTQLLTDSPSILFLGYPSVHGVFLAVVNPYTTSRNQRVGSISVKEVSLVSQSSYFLDFPPPKRLPWFFQVLVQQELGTTRICQHNPKLGLLVNLLRILLECSFVIHDYILQCSLTMNFLNISKDAFEVISLPLLL